VHQTEARKILKDAPIMWRRINSIGVILDCNSTYAAKLGYSKLEIIGKPIFEHVPKESWSEMNKSGLKQEKYLTEKLPSRNKIKAHFQLYFMLQAYMMKKTIFLEATL
jgi:PAS domain S-box-containing protein